MGGVLLPLPLGEGWGEGGRGEGCANVNGARGPNFAKVS